MKLHVVINERAGNGKSKKIWEQYRYQLTTPFQEYITQFPGHGTEIAKQIAQQSQTANDNVLIVVIGGDGTIHEVVNGIVHAKHVAVGFVRAGSGNDFSRGFAFFKSAEEIDDYIVSLQETEMMDCGKISIGDSKVFVNNAGIGFDAYVAYLANRSKVKKYLNKFGLGKLSYVYFVLRSLFSFQCFQLEVEESGVLKKYNRVWFATISNQPYFGGGMKISPQSKPNDEMLELTVVSNLAKWKLLLLFVTVFFGKHTGLKEVSQSSGKQFSLKVSNMNYCHTDGELIKLTDETKPILFSIIPSSWSIVKKTT